MLFKRNINGKHRCKPSKKNLQELIGRFEKIIEGFVHHQPKLRKLDKLINATRSISLP